MKVVLKRNLFIGGVMYRKGYPPAEVPSEYKDRLPEDARVVDDVANKRGPGRPPKKETLKDFDEVRASEEAEADVNNKVHKEQKES